MRLHVSATPSCNNTWKKQFSQKDAKPIPHLPLKTHRHDENSSSSPWDISASPTDDAMETFADNFNLPNAPAAAAAPLHEAIGEDVPNNFEAEVRGRRFSEPYPRSIASPIVFQKTRFEKQREEEKVNGKPPWQPFSSQDEWELAKWLIDNVNQKATDKYLKLPMVS